MTLTMHKSLMLFLTEKYKVPLMFAFGRFYSLTGKNNLVFPCFNALMASVHILAAKLATLADNGQAYKQKLYSTRNKKIIKGAYFLGINAVKRQEILNELLSKTGIFNDVKKDLWLARVMLVELLWGRGTLPSKGSIAKIIAPLKDTFLKILPTLEISKDLVSEEVTTPRYIRINSDILSRESAVLILKENGFEELDCPCTYPEYLRLLKSLKKNQYVFDIHIPYLIAFNRSTNIDQLSHISFIRQDKSSCLVPLLLSPLPGAVILDMCAAPGMKTQHTASLISKMGKIYSLDRNSNRFKLLEQTCDDFKLKSCVEPLHMDAMRVTEEICPNVEYIIVDPPCSGTGMINLLKRHTADENRLRKLGNLQAMILKTALSKFPCTRRIVYSTCSVEEEENEKVVSECLEVAKDNGFSLVPLSPAFRGSFNSGKDGYPCSPFVLRASPENDLTNGFFIALFERSVPLKVISGPRALSNTFKSELVVAGDETNNTDSEEEVNKIFGGKNILAHSKTNHLFKSIQNEMKMKENPSSSSDSGDLEKSSKPESVSLQKIMNKGVLSTAKNDSIKKPVKRLAVTKPIHLKPPKKSKFPSGLNQLIKRRKSKKVKKRQLQIKLM